MKLNNIHALAFSAICAVSVSQVQASTISVTATADNDFIVVHTQGNSFTEILRSSDGDRWRKPQSAKYELKGDNVRGCSIDIIAWDDHSTKQGMAASISGNGGTVLSGSAVMKAFSTKIPNQNQWANANPPYPSTQLISQILGSKIASPTHNHGPVNSTSPWGNISGNGLPANAQWVWAKTALYHQPYANNFTVYSTPCGNLIKRKPPVEPKKGLTWRKIGSDPVTATLDVGCGYSNGANECDPRHGDQLCTTKRPVLCKRELHAPKPASVTESKYHKWAGNVVHTTQPVSPATYPLNTLSDANAFCEAEFGKGWVVASHHDAPGNGWYFKSYGNANSGKGERFWVNIKDQPHGTCWSQ